MLRNVCNSPLSCCPLRAIRGSVMIVSVRSLQNLAKSRSSINAYRFAGVSTPPPGLRRNIERFRIAMSQEEKDRKLKEIEKMRIEEVPNGLFAKLKYYLKRYWYIAIPVHLVCCSFWFAGLYVAVKSGVDVISLMEALHVPDRLVEKVKNIPESAGVVFIALLLYKIVLPIRYATSLAGIQMTFWVLRRLGRLKTVREVEYGVRTGYEKTICRLNERRNRSAMISPNNAANVTPAWTLSRILSRREKLRQSKIAAAPPLSDTSAKSSTSPPGKSEKPSGSNTSGDSRI